MRPRRRNRCRTLPKRKNAEVQPRAPALLHLFHRSQRELPGRPQEGSRNIMRDSIDAGVTQARNPTRHRYYRPGDRRLQQAEALSAIPSVLASLLDSLCEYAGGDPEIQIAKFARTAEKLIAL